MAFMEALVVSVQIDKLLSWQNAAPPPPCFFANAIKDGPILLLYLNCHFIYLRVQIKHSKAAANQARGSILHLKVMV